MTKDLVILCGGKGTRLKSLTKKIPKPLIKINDIPFLDYLINFYQKYDFKAFVNYTFDLNYYVTNSVNTSVQYQVYFDGVGPTGGTNKNLHLRIYDYGGLRMGFFSDDLNSPSGIINFGEWNHIIMQYDFSTDTSEIYHNGVKVASGNQGPFDDTSATFHIGYWASSSTQYFKGNIGCTRVYSKSLTEAEVKQNFEAQKSKFGF